MTNKVDNKKNEFQHVKVFICFIINLIWIHQMNELSLKERACKNMLANVLDMEDDHR